MARWSSPSEYLRPWMTFTTKAVEATPTAFTKEGSVEDWVFLGKETDIKNFTYADVAKGKREQVIDETSKDYVWLSALPDRV
ncbi:hypothetical protein THRCLA_22521 [Thraustotheca clavata]|uniref:Uncharacterized protein n=1 Tax=Thraustotheca clavata TaxID=74557 RepID=A0A1V9YY49_9STRA|nr:hypothetical protein THRCLA_22521 [Thraustotheca clavata]